MFVQALMTFSWKKGLKKSDSKHVGTLKFNTQSKCMQFRIEFAFQNDCKNI